MADGQRLFSREEFLPDTYVRPECLVIMDYAEPCLSESDAHDIRDAISEHTNTDDTSIWLDISHMNVGMHEKRGPVLIDYPWGSNFHIK